MPDLGETVWLPADRARIVHKSCRRALALAPHRLAAEVDPTAAARLAAGLKLGHSSPYQVDVFSLMPELITGSTRSLAAPR